MRINYNVSAMLANNALANNDNRLSQSLERLSSGLKINRAKDNPAGLAMAKRMNAQIEGVSVASQNASDGISVIEIADGAMTEVAEMLQRINELSVKASTGTLADEDRMTIQDEVAQLKEEIARVSETTEFNGQKLLNGEFDLKAYTDNEEIKVSTYSADVPSGAYEIAKIAWTQEADGSYKLKEGADGFAPGAGFPQGATAEIQEDQLIIKGKDGFEMQLDLSETKNMEYTNLKIDATGIGSMRLQVGANEGQVIAVNIPAMSLKNMGIEKVDVSTKEGAKAAIDSVKGAIQFVSKVRGRLGAYQNRLESTVNSLDVTNENMTAAYSRIMDVDMAEEMTNYTTNQVLTQAGTSMLAQANERPSQVLQLLQ